MTSSWVVRVARVLVLVASFLVVTAAYPTVAYAYSGPSAAAYADSAVSPYDWRYNHYGNDCTNFVSQSLAQGGFRFVGFGGSVTDDHNWWDQTAVNVYSSGVTFNTHSASVVQDLWTFLHWDNPGGTYEGNFTYIGGHRAPAFTPNNVNTGDVLFYDWGGGLGLSHNSIQVGWGTDAYGFYGNWVDEHTNDRKHVFWTLKDVPDNTNWQTTTVYFEHIWPQN